MRGDPNRISDALSTGSDQAVRRKGPHGSVIGCADCRFSLRRCGRIEGGTTAMVGLIVILLVGGIVGWLASTVMRTDPRRGAVLNIAVGIAGALLGGVLLAPLVWGASIT